MHNSNGQCNIVFTSIAKGNNEMSRFGSSHPEGHSVTFPVEIMPLWDPLTSQSRDVNKHVGGVNDL